jgi:hypothetical protein
MEDSVLLTAITCEIQDNVDVRSTGFSAVLKYAAPGEAGSVREARESVDSGAQHQQRRDRM